MISNEQALLPRRVCYFYCAMTLLTLHTFIKAPVSACFDLARSTELHLESTQHTGERVVAGRSSGLFELHDEVTWEALHLGIRQRLSTRITGFAYPYFFEDTMTRGAFRSMRHEHHFRPEKGGTLMTDLFRYEVPLGILGRFFDRLYLKRYMMGLLRQRNRLIRAKAEQEAAGRGLSAKKQ